MTVRLDSDVALLPENRSSGDEGSRKVSTHIALSSSPPPTHQSGVDVSTNDVTSWSFRDNHLGMGFSSLPLIQGGVASSSKRHVYDEGDLDFLSHLTSVDAHQNSIGRNAGSGVESHFKRAKKAMADLFLKQSRIQLMALQQSTPPIALLCLSQSNWLRRTAMLVASHRIFEAFMLMTILANCITLALYSNRPAFAHSKLGQDLKITNYVFLGIFILEGLIKIIAQGLIFKPGTYLRDGWNVLDCAVVLLGILDVTGLGSTTAIRSMRVLRPLRAITKIERMRILVVTIIKALPMMVDVLVLAIFFFAVFGVLGVQLFGGQLKGRCGVASFANAVLGPPDAAGRQAVTNVTYTVPSSQQHDVCRWPRIHGVSWSTNDGGATFDVHGIHNPYAGRGCGYGIGSSPDPLYPEGMFCVPYQNPENGGGNVGWRHWDNILFAWLNIFVLINLSNWVYQMFDTQDALSTWTWPAFLAMTVLGAFFLVNLALAVMYLQFQRDREASERELEVKRAAAEAQHRAEEQRHLSGGAVMVEEDPDGLCATYDSTDGDATEGKRDTKDLNRKSWFRAWCYNLMRDERVDNFTTGLIILNIVFMALQWYPMPHRLDLANDWANVGFCFYFAIEMALKLTGLGAAEYVMDNYNLFDACVVVASLVDVIIFMMPGVDNQLGSALSIVRGFRLLKIFRLLVRWRGLARILTVLVESLSSVGWLTMLLFLVIFVWALLGMQLFGYKLAFCNDIEGSNQLCPPGLSNEECPDHWDCYVSCEAARAGSWFAVPGSPYGGQAYCEQFPRTGLGPYEYWAQVGKAMVPAANFDGIVQAFCNVFQIITLDDFDMTMYTCMTTVSPWAALYFVTIIMVGNYMLLNLFLAILIDGFSTLTQEEEKNEQRDTITGKTQAGTELAGSFTEEAGRGGLRKGGSGRVQQEVLSDSGEDGLDGKDEDDTASTIKKLRAMSVSAGTHRHTLQGPALSRLHLAAHTDLQRVASGEGGGGGRASDKTYGDGYQLGSCGPSNSGSPANKAPLSGPSTTLARSVTLGKGGQTTKPAADGGLDAGGERHHHRQELPPDTDGARRRAARVKELCQGRALFIFGPTNCVRRAIAGALVTRTFERTMLVFILASSVALTLDSPLVDETSRLAQALHWLDYIFVVAFGVEAILKFIVRGLAFNGRHSYLRHLWNVLDLFIVLISIVEIVTEALGVNSHITWLRAVRALRALRPLRAATRFASVRVVVDAMFQAIPALGDVAFVTGIFYIIFGILAINLFAGSFSSCVDPDSGAMLDAYYLLPKPGSIDRSWCDGIDHTITQSHYHSSLPSGVDVPPWSISTHWNRPFVNFDNLGTSCLVLFMMSTMENWGGVMYAAGQAVGPGRQPIFNHNPWLQLFFVVFMIVGGFLLMKLVIGVTIDTVRLPCIRQAYTLYAATQFNQMSRQRDPSSVLLTAEQEEWLTIQKMLLATQLQMRYVPPENPLRYIVFSVVFSEAFDISMIVVIVLNLLAMMMDHAGRTPTWTLVFSLVNITITAVFVAEMLLKWLAVGIPAYFRDRWNTFDFVVVVVSVGGVLCDLVTAKDLTYLPLLRILRIIRIFRIIPKAKGLRLLLQTLLWSLPAVFNVGSVLFLFMFVYAIMGMNLFGNNIYGEGDGISRHSNFKNFLSSMLLLYRIMTGENWNSVMEDCVQRTGCMLVTTDWTTEDGQFTTQAGTFVDPGFGGLRGIPKEWVIDQCSPNISLAIMYFCSFQVFCALMLLQLVIGVILANIQSTTYTEELAVGQSHILEFAAMWQELDPFASSFIPVSWLTHLLVSLKPPLGVNGLSNQLMQVHNIVTSVDIPNRDNQVHFLETLHALAGRVAGAELPLEQELQIHKVLIERLPHKDLPKYTAAHFYSAMYVQSAVRGFLARRKLRPLWEVMTNQGSLNNTSQKDYSCYSQGGSGAGNYLGTGASLSAQEAGTPQGDLLQPNAQSLPRNRAPAGRELSHAQQEEVLRDLQAQHSVTLASGVPRPADTATAAGRRALVAQHAKHAKDVQEKAKSWQVSETGITPRSSAGAQAARGLFKLTHREALLSLSGRLTGRVVPLSPAEPSGSSSRSLLHDCAAANAAQCRSSVDGHTLIPNAIDLSPNSITYPDGLRMLSGGLGGHAGTSCLWDASASASQGADARGMVERHMLNGTGHHQAGSGGGDGSHTGSVQLPSNQVPPSVPKDATGRRRPMVGLAIALSGGSSLVAGGGGRYAPSVVRNLHEEASPARDAVLDASGRVVFKHASIARRAVIRPVTPEVPQFEGMPPLASKPWHKDVGDWA